MESHPEKCQVISITRKRKTIIHQYKLHNHILEHVKSTKYLGCTLNEKQDWGEHINNISSRASRNLSFIWSNVNIASTAIKEQAYMSLVRPSLEYTCTIWDPYEKGDTDRLEMIQRRGARYVKKRYHNRSSVTDMLNDLQWKSLEDRRKEARLIMFYKIVNNLVHIPSENRRKPNLNKPEPTNSLFYFHIPFCRTLYSQQSFFPRTIREWNNLLPDILSAGSVEIFRSQLAKHFI